MKNIEIRNGRILYYGNEAGYVENGRAMVDPIFQSDELSDFIAKEKFDTLWTNGVYDRLTAARESVAAGLETPATGRAHGFPDRPPLKCCRIWQLKSDMDIRMKFVGYDELLKNFGEPDSGDYRLAYDGQVETNDLEELYTKFNIDHPPGYEGHSLSMSDVVELYDETGSSFHYVDHFGFKEIGFDPPGQELRQGPALSP